MLLTCASLSQSQVPMVTLNAHAVVNGDTADLFCGGERGTWYTVKVTDVAIVTNGTC